MLTLAYLTFRQLLSHQHDYRQLANEFPTFLRASQPDAEDAFLLHSLSRSSRYRALTYSAFISLSSCSLYNNFSYRLRTELHGYPCRLPSSANKKHPALNCYRYRRLYPHGGNAAVPWPYDQNKARKRIARPNLS
jgi:hypothetical protein